MSGIVSGLALFASLTAFQQSVPSVDHVLIRVTDATPAITELLELGFTVPPDTSVHIGQGTASRGLLFDNGYLELIWVTSPEELAAADSRLAERLLSDVGHSPFGLAIFTPDPASLPFATRSYNAQWMAPDSEILFATTEPDEPVLFAVPRYMSLAERAAGRPAFTSMLPHPNGANRLTNVEFVVPAGESSSEPLRYLESKNVITLTAGQSPLLRIELDGGRAGEVADLRPTLPIVLRY